MIGISNMARLEWKPLETAASTLAVLNSRTLSAPLFIDDKRKVELTPAKLSDTDLQRSDGMGRIVVGGSEQRTRIIDVFQKSPVRIMLPKVPAG
jgi:hypothetical protein